MKKLFIFTIAAILLMVFTTPVMAKFNIGAVIQTDFFWFDQDAENKVGGLVQGTVPGDSDLSFIEISVPSWSRFNITWTNEKDVRARFEVAGGNSATTDGAGINMRHAYGAWQATPNFELMAGWSTSPFSIMNPPQSLGTNAGPHIILLGFGDFYSGRFPQVRGTYKFSDNCRLAVALLDPTFSGNPGFADNNPAVAAATATNAALAAATTAARAAHAAAPTAATTQALATAINNEALGTVAVPASRVDNESKLPRIDIGLPSKIGPLALNPSFFYHAQAFDNVAPGSADDLDAWGLSLGFRIAFGPLSFSGEFQMGDNWAATQSTAAGLYGFAPRVVGTGQVADSDDMGYWIDLAVKLGPVTPHVLYGSRDSENEGVVGPLDDQDRRTSALVFGVTIPVAKTFMISPEIGFYEYDDGALLGATTANPANLPVDMGTQTVVGVKFTVVF